MTAASITTPHRVGEGSHGREVRTLPRMPTFALVTPAGSTLGLYDLDDETEPGAVIRRQGHPDRRVVGLLDYDEQLPGFDVLIVERL